MTPVKTSYSHWSRVPAHLMSRTQIANLDLPRNPSGQRAVAEVEDFTYRGKRQLVDLYDVHRCPPTRTSGKQLEAAAARSQGKRLCRTCGARCQRSLGSGASSSPPEELARLCPACAFVEKLRSKQRDAAKNAVRHAAWASEVLADEQLAVVWVDDVVPEPTPAGNARPMVAVRLRACDVQGQELLDVMVRLVSPRAQFVPDGAIAKEDAAPLVHAALVGRPLVTWDREALGRLYRVAAHEKFRHDVAQDGFHLARETVVRYELPQRREGTQLAYTAAALAVRVWRRQLDPVSLELVPCAPAGTPDRLLYLLRRMAADVAVSDAERQGGADLQIEEQSA